MEIKKILKLKMVKKLPFNNNNLINKKFQKSFNFLENFIIFFCTVLFKIKNRNIKITQLLNNHVKHILI